MKCSFGFTLLTVGLLGTTSAVRAEPVAYRYLTIDASRSHLFDCERD